jgi:hypothetical protein
MKGLEISIEPADYFGKNHSDGSQVILVRVGSESRATTVKQFVRGFTLGAVADIIPLPERDAVAREIYSKVGNIEKLNMKKEVVWDQRWKR